MNEYVAYQLLSSANVGGGERVALGIHRHLEKVRPGLSRLLAAADSPIESFLRESGDSFITFDLERLRTPGKLNTLLSNAELLLRTRTNRPHLVHVHSAPLFGLMKHFARLSSGKLVLHVHLDYSETELTWALRTRADLIVTCADFMQPVVKRALEATGAGHVKVATLRNAVDLEKFRPGNRPDVKRRLGLDPARPVVLHAGNLSPHKGQDKAIRAVHEVVRRSAHRPLLLVAGEERDGKGEFTRALRGLTDDLGAGATVSFLGQRSDIADLLQAADVLVLPSTREGLPLVILEAQAAGAVVIAAPTAGVPEIIEDGRTGFLVAADDPEKYATRLIELLDDEAKSRRITDQARRQVERAHNSERYNSGVIDLYDELMASARA